MRGLQQYAKLCSEIFEKILHVIITFKLLEVYILQTGISKINNSGG
jgi:hypothetical protein